MGKKEDIIKGIVNEMGFIIKESSVTTELGDNELELHLDNRMTSKDEYKLKFLIRDSLKLKDCPRIAGYPKEGLLYPIAIDLYS